MITSLQRFILYVGRQGRKSVFLRSSEREALDGHWRPVVRTRHRKECMMLANINGTQHCL